MVPSLTVSRCTVLMRNMIRYSVTVVRDTGVTGASIVQATAHWAPRGGGELTEQCNGQSSGAARPECTEHSLSDDRMACVTGAFGTPPNLPRPCNPPPPPGGERSLGPESIGNIRRRRKFLQGAEADLHCDAMVQIRGAIPPLHDGPPPPLPDIAAYAYPPGYQDVHV